MFTVSAEDHKRISDWVAELRVKHSAKFQTAREGPFKNCFTDYGAIGGGLTYSFTPNNIGLVFTVTEALTGEVLDLSDYDSW
jgi:hypothetical protein